MSFILDALKKSESERQRQSGPALFEVKIAPPRSRFATWGAAIGALLIINFVVVGIVLWRGSASRAAAPAPAVQAAPVAPAPSGVSSPAPQAATPDARFGARTPTAAAPSTTGSTAVTGATGATADANPDDLAAAVEPRKNPAQPANSVVHATESGLPTYQDAAAEPGANIPSLSLDLHVYSPQPDQRFVFLNMTKLREGDASPQGVRVEHITPEGVILSYQGKQFVLQRH